MSPKPLTGGCLCGQVCYEAAGWPYNVAHCHCEDCRRASGAAFVTWVSFKRADRIRSFCPDCGTALTFLASEEAEELDVTVASLDDSKALQPAAHIWVEDKLPWVKLADGLPTHPRSRT
ncbi:MAG: GFA family protein [Verrucomicrobia bacterium]|nr:MAG: GFA family protein [Verrucomicrobiota bacterium]